MSHLTDTERAALALFNRLISEGWEYPDAEWRVHCKTGIPCDALRELYDSQYD